MKSLYMVTLILSGSLAFAGGGTIGSDTASTCLEIVNKAISTAQETQGQLQALRGQVSDARLAATLDRQFARVQSRAPKFKNEINDISRSCADYKNEPDLAAAVAKQNTVMALSQLFNLQEFNKEVRMGVTYDRSCKDFSKITQTGTRERMPPMISVNYSNDDLNWGAMSDSYIKLDAHLALIERLYNSNNSLNVVCEKSEDLTPSYDAGVNTLTFRYSAHRQFLPALIDRDLNFGEKILKSPYSSDVRDAILKGAK